MQKTLAKQVQAISQQLLPDARLVDMSREKVVPNTFTFNSAISACEKCGEWQQALNLLQEIAAQHWIHSHKVIHIW